MSTMRLRKPSTTRLMAAAAVAHRRKRSSSPLKRSLMVVSSGRDRRGVVLGKEGVDGAVQADRHRLNVAGAGFAQEALEALVLVQHQVVVQAVDALRLQQARHGMRLRPLER